MNIEKNIQSFNFIMRAILLIVTLFSFFTLYIWQTSPKSVDAFGKTFILDKYETDYKYRLAQGKELVKNNKPSDAFTHFEKLLADMSKVKKTDNLHSTKRTVFITLIKVSIELGKDKETISLLNSLVEYNDRDIYSKLLMANSFLDIKNKEEDGFIVLQNLHNQFPNNHNISKQFTSLLIKQNKLAEAFHAYYGHKFTSFAQNDNWTIVFHNGGGFKKSRNSPLFVKIKENRELHTALNFPSNTKEILIAPPKTFGLALEYGIVTIENKTERRTFNFDYRNTLCNNYRNVASCSVITDTKEPFFLLQIPKDFDISKGFYFSLNTTVHKEPLLGFNRILADYINIKTKLLQSGLNYSANTLNAMGTQYNKTINIEKTRTPVY